MLKPMLSGAAASSPAAVVPLYAMTQPNEEVLLWNGAIRITSSSGIEANCEGRVSVAWVPNLRVALHASFSDFSGLSLDDSVRVAPLDGNPESAEGVLTRLVHDSNGTIATGMLTELGFRGSGEADRVVFALANFPRFVGESVRYPSGSVARARVRLESDEWLITVDAVDNLNKQLELLRESGGFSITHVGEAIRRDGKSTDPREIERLLDALQRLFSFARGAWEAPLLATGLDGSGHRFWQQWGPWIVDPWNPVPNWFPRIQGGSLGSIFTSFMKRWNDALWHEPLDAAIYWYVQANNAKAIEAPIILSQVGLELLAWVSLVEEQQVVSRTGFDRLPAADKLRLLLGESGVELSIPKELSELSSLATKHSWVDGPDALTALRNDLIHPSFQKRQRVFSSSFDTRAEAARLTVWYLELALLRLLDYDGEYTNRITATSWADVELVPWA
jgi:hypothetical protein